MKPKGSGLELCSACRKARKRAIIAVRKASDSVGLAVYGDVMVVAPATQVPYIATLRDGGVFGDNVKNRYGQAADALLQLLGMLVAYDAHYCPHVGSLQVATAISLAQLSQAR